MSSEPMSGAQVRRALAGALAGVARGLSASARMVEQASWILRPREPAASERPTADEPVEPPGDVAPAEPEPAAPADAEPPAETEPVTAAGPQPPTSAEAGPGEPAGIEEPAVSEVDPSPEPPPTVGAPEGPDRVRVAETHIAELADRPVAEVTARISDLSTDELEQLYAHEVTHKNRKTVLRAIERAVAPASSSP